MEKTEKSYLCKVCGEVDTLLFYNGTRNTCKKCISVKNKLKYAALPEEEKKEKNQYTADWQRNNIIRTRFLGARNRVKNKELEFTITEEFITKLILRQNYRCALSGKAFDVESDKYSPSLERIDSSIGYTPENVMWVCSMVNYMKAEYTQDDFFEMVERIYKKRQLQVSE